jgi:dTDP-4-amino-4,6-dideoxygalactose transaminase
MNAYGRYESGLAPLVESGTVQVQSIPQHCGSNFHLFYVLVEDLRTRTRLIEHLKQHGIHAVFHYVPLHTSPVGEAMGYRAGMLPVTEHCADRLVRLPLYAGLRDDEVDRIVERVRGFFGR